MRTGVTATAVTSIVLLVAGTSLGTTIRVPSEQPTIQEGIEAASGGDTVLVAPNTYYGVLNQNLDFGGVSMVLKSEGGADVTAICPSSAGRGFYFGTDEDTTLVIDGFTIVNAAADSGAGAFCVRGASPKFMNCRFVANDATTRGGGFAGVGSSAILYHCVFEDNGVYGAQYAYGGALACMGYSDLKVIGCDFVDNTSDGFGGAVYCHLSDPFFSACTFDGNTANSSGGGAMFCGVFSSPTISWCTFVDNSGPSGGAIYTQSSPLTVTSCTFDGNVASAAGGAIRFLYASSNGTVSGCTFTDNWSPMGGAVACALDADAQFVDCTLVSNSGASSGSGFHCNDASPTVTNCIIAFADMGEAAGCSMGTETPVFDYCILYANGGGDGLCGAVGDTMHRDPRFCDMSAGDYSLCSNSPAIAANNAWGQPVGAFGSGCSDCDSPVETSTWGSIKAMYR